MDICDIRHFLYEIDSVLSDEQIFQLADEIFNNKEKLLELIKDIQREDLEDGAR